MSYGDPHQPYGPPPVGQPSPPQAPYGQPQYGPQGYAAPAPGPYPQFQGPGGYPGPPVPTHMPSGVSSARVMLYVIAGLQVLGLAFFIWLAAFIDSKREDVNHVDDPDFQEFADVLSGFLWVFIAVAAVWGIACLVLGAQLASGGPGLRMTTIVFSVVTAVVGLSTFPLGIVHLVLVIMITVFLSRPDSERWFQRRTLR